MRDQPRAAGFVEEALATDPAHNTIPALSPGRRTCRNTSSPRDAAAKAEDAHADAAFAKGAEAGSTSDKYIRPTVFLATMLFLVAISGHFRISQARLGLSALRD